MKGLIISLSKLEALPLRGHSDWNTGTSNTLAYNFQRKFTVKVNLALLIMQLVSDLNRWWVLPLSIWGKVNIIKMNAGPGILFTFNSLPIHIPEIYFNKTNMLRLFLWDIGNQTRKALQAL